LSTHIEYNISENIYLAAGAYLGIGEHLKLLFPDELMPYTEYHSEFGAYPNIYFSSFRVYF
ncbi:MAG: hypothetical protein DRP26_03045, partial [Candidatus Zixiibacteriota bacterium]